MSIPVVFRSAWAEAMEQFVAFKQMQGYEYSSQARTLSYFDRFLLEQSVGGQPPGLQRELLDRYVQSLAHLQPLSRRAQLSSVREFTRYLHARCPQSPPWPKEMGPRLPRKVRFIRIEPEQVAALLAAAIRVLTAQGIQAHSVAVLIGLLYATGLRIREALGLSLGDLDPKTSTLHVARGKGGKQRLVPLSPSTLGALEGYLELRAAHARSTRGSPLFISYCGQALSYCQAYDGFRRLCGHCGLLGPPTPRFHDLRHNYACRRVALWREEGKDVNALLPLLATAMGHVNIRHTQIYLHLEPGELQHAATLLNHRLHPSCEASS